MTPPPSNFADSAAGYQAALTSLFSGRPEDTEADLARVLTPTFTMRAGAETFDFAGFVEHMRGLRAMGLRVSLTTEQFLRDGAHLAERHSSETVLPDGQRLRAETFMFAEVAEDGRIACIVEAVERFGG